MRLVDLSFLIEEGMPVYPGDTPVTIKRPDGQIGSEWLTHAITMGSHCGTHIEAPAHSIKGGKMLKEYPLHRFCGPATTIAWEDIGRGKIETPILNLYSGFDQWWGHEKYFSSPHLTLKQAEWISNARIKIFGIDTISVGDNTIHRIIQEKDILIVESMCNLKEILNQQAELYFFPLKLATEASPIRGVAKLL